MFPEYTTAIQQLIETGHFFFSRGWVPATSGNFSTRLNAEQIAVTVSGQHKGRLTPDGILRVDLNGQPLTTGKKPSAETLLHTALYRRDPTLGAVLHTHSVPATTLSLWCRNALLLRDYEVLKAFPGVVSHDYEIQVPIFPNDQDMTRLAGVVNQYLDSHLDTYGYLIAGHGFYTWGSSLADACRHVEAFEFLFECELLLRRLHHDEPVESLRNQGPA